MYACLDGHWAKPQTQLVKSPFLIIMRHYPSLKGVHGGTCEVVVIVDEVIVFDISKYHTIRAWRNHWGALSFPSFQQDILKRFNFWSRPGTIYKMFFCRAWLDQFSFSRRTRWHHWRWHVETSFRRQLIHDNRRWVQRQICYLADLSSEQFVAIVFRNPLTRNSLKQLSCDFFGQLEVCGVISQGSASSSYWVSTFQAHTV